MIPTPTVAFAVWAAAYSLGLPFRYCQLIHAVEMALESIYVSGPKPAELSQPDIQLLKWIRFQPVETALCVHPGFYETRFS